MSASDAKLKGILRQVAKVRALLRTAQPHAISQTFVFAEMGAAAGMLRKIERELESLIGEPDQ